ncbi:unnamed protein product [Dracunculus medinensis]|uniref:Histone domain-containing protein n=1 Tax=Dracunculus medinensis TaxID=318479 RepID=A0A0N4ULR9_DRAME|nr:unnamed protein product [Dracunculus medinensis]
MALGPDVPTFIPPIYAFSTAEEICVKRCLLLRAPFAAIIAKHIKNRGKISGTTQLRITVRTSSKTILHCIRHQSQRKPEAYKTHNIIVLS